MEGERSQVSIFLSAHSFLPVLAFAVTRTAIATWGGSSCQASQSMFLLFRLTPRWVQTSPCPNPVVPQLHLLVSLTLPSPLNRILSFNSFQLCLCTCYFFLPLFGLIFPSRLSGGPQRDPILAKSRAQGCPSPSPLIILVSSKRASRSPMWAPVLEGSELPGFQKPCLLACGLQR